MPYADIDHMLRLGLAIGDHLAPQGRERNWRQRDHADKADGNDQNQLETDAGKNHRCSHELAMQICQFILNALASFKQSGPRNPAELRGRVNGAPSTSPARGLRAG
ncbi:hypothetical protein ACVWXO_004155 [Bradyrhizobium sp. LM2.7]